MGHDGAHRAASPGCDSLGRIDMQTRTLSHFTFPKAMFDNLADPVGDLVRVGQFSGRLDTRGIEALIAGVFASPLLEHIQLKALQSFLTHLCLPEPRPRSCTEFLALDYGWYVHRKVTSKLAT